MSTLQALDASEAGVALRIARAISGRSQRRPGSQPDIGLVATAEPETSAVTASPPLSIADESAVRADIQSPERLLLDVRYDDECKLALAPLLDELLDRFEGAGWNRNKVAYEMMHLAARRMNGAR